MMWIEYDYVCNENLGITLRKKVEYNEKNLAIAQQEAVNGEYTITEDEEVAGVQPMPISLGGTNAKTAEEACKNIGGINTYTHSSNGLTGMGTNGKFKATTTGSITTIKVNGTTCTVKCGEDVNMDLVAGCWYTFIREGNIVNFNSGGAGGGLNFKVVGGFSAPASPKENTIWINTSVAITGWVFSATQPSNPSEGMVWITIGTSSTIEFNALKKNGIQVYPISAKLYIGGVWQDKTAKSYQNGAWVDWYNGELWKDGNQYEEITGGWTSAGYIYYNTNYVKLDPVVGKTITLEASKMSGGSSTTCIYGTKDAINLTDKKTVLVDVLSTTGYASITVTDSGKNVHPNKSVANKTLSAGTTALDVSSLDGMYYIAVCTTYSSDSTTNKAVVNNIRWE